MATRTIDYQTAAAAQPAGVGRDGAPANGDRLALDPSAVASIDQVQALKAEVESLRRRTQALSHQAGMAEVATTALHNVGNVLNSVNVSVSVVVQRLKESRVSNLSKALALVREHRGELGRFLVDDPKGRMLPEYLENLAQHLLAEHAQQVRELESLVRSVDHLKEIVTVQQNYARKCGVLETLSPAELVEDALRMNWAAFERHGVTIVREFSATPSLTVDKHKVLQILVNLIRNAKYAMDELGLAQKILTLRICAKDPQTLEISVRDNGIGIAPENLARVFELGFTTRREGHGFGLHGGTLAACELGGRLTAHSDGVGQGALFCLELPFARAAAPHNENARGLESNSQRP